MKNVHSDHSMHSSSSVHTTNESQINYKDSSFGIPDVGDADMFDSKCDPANPFKIRFEDICMAEFKIRKGLFRTACDKSRLSEGFGMEIYLKKELHQYTGSFKERGARHALLCLTEEQKKKGVVAASSGNHALALAYHGKNMNIPVMVVMPKITPLMKINSCINFGAIVLLEGKDFCEAKRVALKKSKKTGMIYISGYDHPDVLAGQGTIGLQIAEQVPEADVVIIPVGGGGLIAGIAIAMKTLNKDILIYGVESENCPSMYNSIKAGKPMFTPSVTSIADGLSVSTVGVNAFYTVKGLIDRLIVVEEDLIALSILRLLEVEKIVVEGAGAAALAPILAGKVPELIGKRVVLCLCGGNIDTTVLGRCIERGLAFAGRLIRFVVTLPDCPGSIMGLSTLLANEGVSIKDILHERSWLTSDIFSVQVKIVCETRDAEHSSNLKTLLFEKYDKILWGPQNL